MPAWRWGGARDMDESSEQLFGQRAKAAEINVTLEAQRYVAWLKEMTGEPLSLAHPNQMGICGSRRRDDGTFGGAIEIGEAKADYIGCGSKWDKLGKPRRSDPFASNAFGLSR